MGELENLQNAREDFEVFLRENKFADCQVIIDNLGDSGYPTEAMFLHRALLRKMTGGSSEDGDVKETMLRANDEE